MTDDFRKKKDAVEAMQTACCREEGSDPDEIRSPVTSGRKASDLARARFCLMILHSKQYSTSR